MYRIIIFTIILLLAACQATPTVESTPVQPLQVAVSSSLTWLEPELAVCAAEAGVAVQRADERPADSDVISLRLGVPRDEESYAAVLGEERLVLIVHPDNPLEELTLVSAQAIFSGREKSWPDQSEIHLWALPESSDAGLALAGAGFDFSGAGLAPTPESMLELVAGDPAAIGYLPAHWLDTSVRALDVDGLNPVPILAVSAAEPQGAARALLVCLQQKIGK